MCVSDVRRKKVRSFKEQLDSIEKQLSTIIAMLQSEGFKLPAFTNEYSHTKEKP